MTRENLLNLLQQCGEHISDYEMADCLSNLLHLNNQSTDLFDTMNAEDACNTDISPSLFNDDFLSSGQFVENQLPEQVTLQTFTEDLLKMPSQYVDQVMYSLQLQQEQQQRHATFADLKEKRREHPTEHQQRGHSTLTTSTTRSGTSNSNRS